MIRTFSLFVAALAIGAVTMFGVVELGSSEAFAEAVSIEPMPDAGAVDAPAAPSVTVNAGSGATINVEASKPAVVVPDPVADPEGAIATLTKLYKDGALAPFIIVFVFFALVYAERKVAWLRTGYRKVIVSSVLYGLGMLVERAITGTTPNLSMMIGAVGNALVFAIKSYGARPTAEA